MASNRYYDSGQGDWMPVDTLTGWNSAQSVEDGVGELRISYSTTAGFSNTAFERVIEYPMKLAIGKGSAERIQRQGLMLVRDRMEMMARAHEDFAEYVNDPAKHPIHWTYEVETWSGWREVWPGPPTPLYGEAVSVYFIANYNPSEE